MYVKRVCVYICMYICIFIYIYIHTYIHTHIHTYIHTYIHKKDQKEKNSHSIHVHSSYTYTYTNTYQVQVFINNRDFASSQNGQMFACSEYLRAVTLSTGQTAIADSENVCVFERINDNVVKGAVRGLVYLVPTPTGREGDMYMQIGPRAVAVYDYIVEMKRVV
jgi:hypothetical protein